MNDPREKHALPNRSDDSEDDLPLSKRRKPEFAKSDDAFKGDGTSPKTPAILAADSPSIAKQDEKPPKKKGDNFKKKLLEFLASDKPIDNVSAVKNIEKALEHPVKKIIVKDVADELKSLPDKKGARSLTRLGQVQQYIATKQTSVDPRHSAQSLSSSGENDEFDFRQKFYADLRAIEQMDERQRATADDLYDKVFNELEDPSERKQGWINNLKNELVLLQEKGVLHVLEELDQTLQQKDSSSSHYSPPPAAPSPRYSSPPSSSHVKKGPPSPRGGR